MCMCTWLHVAAALERRRSGAVETHQVARRVDAELPVLDDRPLRREGLARHGGQPGGVDAQVQVQEGVAPLHALDARLQLGRQRGAHVAGRAAAHRPAAHGRVDELARAP